MKFVYLFLSILLTIIGCNSSIIESPSNTTKSVLSGKTMGTTYNVVIAHPKESSVDTAQIKNDIDNLLNRLNQQVSTYIPDSQISLFNQNKTSKWVSIDQEFFSVVKAAQKISEASNGAFDISVSPLINLWGFGPDKFDNPPRKDQIQLALANVDFKNLELNTTHSSIKKSNIDMKIDLSAIAKGLGVDKVSKYLSQQGHNNHLVEIGGELRASGLNQDSKKWRIAVEQPDTSVRSTQNGLELDNRGVATSGDYRNYFVENGVRRSHIINPKTGYPISHKLASITVIHESTMLADAYATAILVLGEIEGKTFVKENNLDALMIIRDKDKFKFWSSSDLFK